MPFRLSNAPVAFQTWFINEVLGDLMDICVVGYLDNILVYSDSLEDHQDHIHEVLHRLHTVGLYTNPKKCSFHMDTVEYLGFILSPKGLQMDPTKVSMILDWPEPWKVQDVQAFLGFANFYWRFIHAPQSTESPASLDRPIGAIFKCLIGSKRPAYTSQLQYSVKVATSSYTVQSKYIVGRIMVL